MEVRETGETREPRRGMHYRQSFTKIVVQVRRVYPWGRGHRVQYEYPDSPGQWREESLSSFRRGFVKE